LKRNGDFDTNVEDDADANRTIKRTSRYTDTASKSEKYRENSTKKRAIQTDIACPALAISGKLCTIPTIATVKCGSSKRFDSTETFTVGTKKTGKGRRKIGRKKRRMRSKIRHRKD